MDKNDVVNVLLEDGNVGNVNNSCSVFVPGEKVFIRTISHHLTGKVKQVSECFGTGFLFLEDAAWIASDGRFMQAIEDGQLEEIEPVTCLVRLNITSIIDVYVWRHPLPRLQK